MRVQHFKNPLGCPFCGKLPDVKTCLGGGPRKTMVACENSACVVRPFVIGGTRARAVRRWNHRKIPSAPER